MIFKLVVDILASIASLIAITSVGFSWYKSTRKPLKITQVMALKDKDHTTVILKIRNIQNYPVFITDIKCYKRKIFQVNKIEGDFPEYAEVLGEKEIIFIVFQPFEVPAKAYKDIRIEVPGKPKIPSNVLFLITTSHGYQEITCRNINVIEMGKVTFFVSEYMDKYSSKSIAKLAYFSGYLKELTSRFFKGVQKNRLSESKALVKLKTIAKSLWFYW